jgi:hypothetical protein
VLHDDGRGTCLSCTDDLLTVTLANPKAAACEVQVTVTAGSCDWSRGQREVLSADSLDACDYAYRLSREAVCLPPGPSASLSAPPLALAAYTFPRVRR